MMSELVEDLLVTGSGKFTKKSSQQDFDELTMGLSKNSFRTQETRFKNTFEGVRRSPLT